MRRLAAILLLAAGCGPTTAPPAAPPEPPPAPAPSTSLHQQLLEKAGDQVAYVVAGEGGLVVKTTDRELHRFTTGGVIADYADELDLIFVIDGGTLSVIDLRLAAPTPIELVRDVPDTPVMLGGKVNRALNGGGTPEYLEVVWEKSPKTALGLTFDEVMNPEQAAAIEKASLIGGDWLVAQLDRSLRTDVSRSPKPTSAGAPTDGCDEEDPCGLGVDFGKSGWTLYMSRFECGDYCYSSCLLYDPATKRIAEPAAKPEWKDAARVGDLGGSCGPFLFDSAQTSFASANGVCQVGGECVDLGGTILGSLQPGVMVNLGG